MKYNVGGMPLYAEFWITLLKADNDLAYPVSGLIRLSLINSRGIIEASYFSQQGEKEFIQLHRPVFVYED